MKRKLWFAVLAVLLWSPMAMAANSVVVETKSVALNAAGVPIGIYVTNDVILQQYVQPLKLVSVSGGAFITGLQVSPNASARMNGKLAEIMIYNGYQTPDGACFTTAPNVGFGTIWPGPDGIPSTGDEGIDLPNPPMPVTSSPAALMVVRGKVFGATLPAGTDGTFPGGSPSFTIGVGINGCSGQFEVDTTCTDPANHLVFAKLTAPVAVIPTFQKGVITVGTGVNQPPVAVNDTYNTNEDTPLEVPAPGVIGNDTDCQPLTAVKVTDPSHGAVTLNSDGSFTYAPEPNYSGPDAFTYNASDGAAQGNTATVSITVLTCDVNAGPDKVLTCTVTQINLSGSTSTPGAIFSWAASGGGNIVSGANTATLLVNAAGIYTLTVTNVEGCQARDTALVTRNNTAPDANAGPDKVLTCVVTQINLAGSSSTGGATFAWVASAGGHIMSGATTATPLVDAVGTYTLTVTNPANGCTATDVALVIQNVTPPNANAGPDKVLDCAVTQVNLAGSSTTPGATFSWVASAGGHIVSGANTATPLVDAAGTYTLTVTNPANGCTASDVALVTLNATPPNVNAGSDKVLTCTVTQINLSGSSSTPGATFSWVASNGGNIVSGANTATPLVNAAGTYTLTVTNPANGCTASDVALVTLNVTPPNASAGPDKVLTCVVTQVNLAGSSSTPGATFSWVASAGGHIVSGANTATPLIDAAGTYTLTVTDPANGCTASDVALVTQNVTPPNANAGPDKVLNCTVTQINLSGSSSTPGATFSWVASAGGHIVSGANTATPLVDAAGTYTLTVTDPANGCSATDVALVTQDITKPVLSCAGDELTGDSLMATASVTSIPSVGVSYIWFPDPVSGQGTPFARYDTPGSKKVVVTILATGCRDSCEAVITGTPVVNHPPVARDTSWATNQDTPKAVAYLPASDADAGQVLTYAIVSGPAHGGISGFNSATGAFTYTPTGGYSGPDVLTFSACDNGAPSLCDTGTVSITVNVNNTPAGTNVLVALPGPVTLNFQHVDVAGITTLTTGSVGPPPPAGFQILPPSQPVYYDLWTTAQFTGLVTVCFPYDPSTTVDPASLQLLHYDAGQALWVQVLPVTIDQVAHTICGDVSSFSIFAVGTPIGTGGELASRIMIRPFAWQPTKKASPSQGKVNGWIGNLESGHGVAEILASSIRLNGTVPILERSAKIVGFDEGFTGPVLMVSFDRQQAMASLGPVPPGMYTVVVTGSLTGGATFRGETEVRVPGSPKTVVEEDLPFDFELGQSYPNPANPSANIEFALPYDGETRLEVFDILGRRVRTLVDGFRMAGRQTVTWDGRDANGNEVGSGVYLYRLVFDQSVQTKKLILLK